MRPSYQPDTSFRSYFASSGASAVEVFGNLPPISVPAKPASRVSARHVSTGVSPPSEGRSSFVQVIGLMPSLIAMKVLPARQEAYRQRKFNLYSGRGPSRQ